MANWQITKIGQFLKEREGRYDSTDSAVQSLKRLNKIDFSGEIHLSDKGSKTDMIIVEPGDLVISGINVSKGALAVYHGDEQITATIHYSSYVFDEQKIDIEYFKRFVKSQSFVQALKEQVKGGIKTEIKPKHFLLLEICLPNIESQREIVSFFNRVENEMDELSSEITHQQSYLKKLCQQILQEAIEGKLTAEWRKKNPALISNENRASKLLEKIKAEKEKRIEKGDIREAREISNSKTIRSLTIPNSWIWAKGDDVFFVTKLAGFEYTKYIKLRESGEVPVIRAQNVRPLEISKESLLFIDLETSKILDRSALTKTCLLVTFIGAGIGDIATFNEKDRWHLAPNVAKMEPYGEKEYLSIKFLNYYLLSRTGQDEVFKHIKATAQPCLSMGTIRDIDYPIPPLAEQKAIVERVEKLMAMIDELEKQVTERKDQSDKLMQSVLREAFTNK